jgi:hypothetical protein
MTLTESIGDIVADILPKIVADAIDRLAADSDDRFETVVLEMIAGYVRVYGPDAIDEAAGLIQAAISARSQKARSASLFDMHQAGLEMSAFTDELQSAEAAQRKRAARIGAIVAAIFRGFSASAREALVDKID